MWWLADGQVAVGILDVQRGHPRRWQICQLNVDSHSKLISMNRFIEDQTKMSLQPPEVCGTRKMGETKAGCQETLYTAFFTNFATSWASFADAGYPDRGTLRRGRIGPSSIIPSSDDSRCIWGPVHFCANNSRLAPGTSFVCGGTSWFGELWLLTSRSDYSQKCSWKLQRQRRQLFLPFLEEKNGCALPLPPWQFSFLLNFFFGAEAELRDLPWVPCCCEDLGGKRLPTLEGICWEDLSLLSLTTSKWSLYLFIINAVDSWENVLHTKGSEFEMSVDMPHPDPVLLHVYI